MVFTCILMVIIPEVCHYVTCQNRVVKREVIEVRDRSKVTAVILRSCCELGKSVCEFALPFIQGLKCRQRLQGLSMSRFMNAITDGIDTRIRETSCER